MLESRRDSSLMSAMEAATVAVALAQPEEQRQPRCFSLGLHHIIAAHQKMPLPLRVDIPHSVHSFWEYPYRQKCLLLDSDPIKLTMTTNTKCDKLEMLFLRQPC